MRSVGSPHVSHLLGASLVAVAGVTLSIAGCSSDPVRTSGNPNGQGATSGSAAGTSSAGGSDPAGGTGATAGSSSAGTDPGTGGTGTSGSAGTGTAGDTSSAGGTGGSGAGGSGGDVSQAGTSSAGSAGAGVAGAGGTMPCQMAEYSFEPKIPTVFMLVDQSGSMFACQTGGSTDPTGTECADQANTSWYPLRDGALQLIEALQADVRFGFAPLGGDQNDMCPDPTPVLPDFNNYAAISERYTALKAILNGETPISRALETVGELLLADDAPGDRFILLVTDGEPDYCNNGDGLCPADSAVFKLQSLYTQGIQTLVFGLPAPMGMFGVNAPSILAAFANAGVGQPAVRPGNYAENRLWDECNFKTPWAADLALSGKPAERGTELGTYSAEGGTGIVYQPEETNQQALIELLSAALSAVKSCTFDLSNVNGQSIKVDLNKLAEASVAIEGTQVPLDMTSGWSMASQTQLVLNGAACDTWRLPESVDIAFNFPCNTIIFE
jgi:hypothetical protein